MADDGPFFETFDATAARISQSHLAAKLNQGPRDDGRAVQDHQGHELARDARGEARGGRNRERGVTLVDPTKAVSLHTVKRAADAPREREKTKKAKKEKKDGDDADDDAGAAVVAEPRPRGEDPRQVERAQEKKGRREEAPEERRRGARSPRRGSPPQRRPWRRSTWRTVLPAVGESTSGWSKARPRGRVGRAEEDSRDAVSRRGGARRRRRRAATAWSFCSTTRCARSKGCRDAARGGGRDNLN